MVDELNGDLKVDLGLNMSAKSNVSQVEVGDCRVAINCAAADTAKETAVVTSGSAHMPAGDS